MKIPFFGRIRQMEKSALADNLLPVPVASYLQMSSARLASPESDATLRATSCTASASNTLSPESRAATISLS